VRGFLRGLSWLLFLAMPWACVWAESTLAQRTEGRETVTRAAFSTRAFLAGCSRDGSYSGCALRSEGTITARKSPCHETNSSKFPKNCASSPKTMSSAHASYIFYRGPNKRAPGSTPAVAVDAADEWLTITVDLSAAACSGHNPSLIPLSLISSVTCVLSGAEFPEQPLSS